LESGTGTGTAKKKTTLPRFPTFNKLDLTRTGRGGGASPLEVAFDTSHVVIPNSNNSSANLAFGNSSLMSSARISQSAMPEKQTDTVLEAMNKIIKKIKREKYKDFETAYTRQGSHF